MIKSALWMGLERLAQLTSTIAIAGILLPFLGEENYSAWQYSFTLYSVLLAFTWICGTELLTPILLSLPKANRQEVTISFIQIKLATSILISLTSIALGFLQSNIVSTNFLVLTALLLLFREPLMTGFSILQVDRKLDVYSKIAIIGVALKLFSIYLIMHLNAGASLIAIPWLLEGFFVSIITFKIADLNFSAAIHQVNWKSLAGLLKRGFVVWLTVVLTIVYFKLDKLYLKTMIGESEYTRYAAASLLNENFLALSTMMIQIIAPYYVYRANDPHVIRRRIIKTSFIYCACLLAAATIVALCSTQIGLLIFKIDFLSENLPTLIFLLPIFGIDGLLNSYCYRFAKQKILLSKSALMLISMVLINLSTRSILSPVTSQVLSIYIGLLLAVGFTLYHLWGEIVSGKNFIEFENNS